MKIEYSNKVKKKLKDEASIRKNYGKLSEGICVALSVLKVVEYLIEIPNTPPTRRHKLSNNKWAIDINKNWRILLIPSNGDCPENINEVVIDDIVDYH